MYYLAAVVFPNDKVDVDCVHGTLVGVSVDDSDFVFLWGTT